MKVIVLTFTSLALLVSACGQNQKTVEQRLTDLERRLSALEKASPLSASIAQSSAAPAQTNSPLKLVSWDYRFGHTPYSEVYVITLNLKNNSTKDIRMTAGIVQFTDPLGTVAFQIAVDPDKRIPAGKIVTQEGEYNLNPYVREQRRMAEVTKADIKATLIVTKLVFADNSTGQYPPP